VEARDARSRGGPDSLQTDRQKFRRRAVRQQKTYLVKFKSGRYPSRIGLTFDGPILTVKSSNEAQSM